MIAQAVATARAAGVTGQIVVRGDSAYGNGVVAACRRADARFSLVLTKNRAVAAAIATIPEHAWTPVTYPGAVRDPDTGEWISDAEVAETAYTAFASTPHAVTARLVVRRVKDARYPDALFPVWRYHPFFTDTDDPAPAADIAHRRHAIIETVFADLIDGPLAHMPSGRFGANSAWILCAADRAQPAPRHRCPRRRRPRRRPRGHPAPAHRQHPRPPGPTSTPTGPAPTVALALGISLECPVAQHHRPQPTTAARHRLTNRRKAQPEHHRKSWADQQILSAHHPKPW